MSALVYIISYHRDFPRLVWCLRSVFKNLHGDYKVLVGIPRADLGLFLRTVLPEFETRIGFFHTEEQPGRGFMAQEILKCEADVYGPGFPHYIHLDSDTMVLKPTHIDQFFRDGKPVWYYGLYSDLIPKSPALANWQQAVQDAVGARPLREYMRRFPIVIPATVYPATRAKVEQHTRKRFSEYVYSCRSDFPQTFAEFNTLGFVADTQGHDVRFVDWKDSVWLGHHFGQWWSRGGLDDPMDVNSVVGYKSARQMARDLGIE